MRVRGLRLRLCLCGWWAIAPHTSPALPDAPLLEQQTDWLAPARSQLLRRAHIARRTAVLDLGTGHGAVVPELVRRSRGLVIALDRDLAGLREEAAFAGACRLGADARHVPIVDGALDLILSQLTLLWVSPLELAIAEIWRTLGPEGALLALEPDYGGMIEHPPEIRSRELWLRGLARAGADPYVGRKLPGLLADQGFEVHVSLFDSLVEPKLERFDFL
ncbi:MAG: methyltransferase domain-containing protein, partial [Anaerolineae bacterium]